MSLIIACFLSAGILLGYFLCFWDVSVPWSCKKALTSFHYFCLVLSEVVFIHRFRPVFSSVQFMLLLLLLLWLLLMCSFWSSLGISLAHTACIYCTTSTCQGSTFGDGSWLCVLALCSVFIDQLFLFFISLFPLQSGITIPSFHSC